MFNHARRGTAKVLATKQMGTLVVTMLYPAVLTYYYQHLGEEGAIKALRRLGAMIVDDFLKIYPTKRDNFKDYIKDYFQIFYNSEVKIKKINKYEYHVIDKNCILCMDIEIEDLPFHYCTPYGGSIERMLNILVERGNIPNFKYRSKTIASKGSGDPNCVHEIKLEEI